jgi:hypothetical protein
MRWFLPVQVAPNLHSSKQVSSWLAVPGIIEKIETLKLKRLFQMSKANEWQKDTGADDDGGKLALVSKTPEVIFPPLSTIPMGSNENAIRLPQSLLVHF